MHRLSIERNEAVADLIERILEVQDQELVLIVPKGSRLVDSPSNFRLIAREAGVLAKDISIESVDQEVLEMARAAGIAASHPLFDEPAKTREGQSLSDIRLRGSQVKVAGEKKLKVKPEPEPEPELEMGPEEDEEPKEDAVTVITEETEDVYEERVSNRRDVEEERYDTLEPRPRRGRKVAAWAIVILLLVAGGMWLAAAAFGKASVDIAFRENPWTYSGTVTASVASKSTDAGAGIVPAEMIEQSQNLPSRSFPATGRTSGGQKARGTITVVNAYSGASQELVATTRFTAPDGKIYRLDNGIIVPGATVGTDGRVTASSSIKAAVTADQPGEGYNTGPVAHLNIPGFQNTPKYNGFYGVLAEGASGGTSTGGPTPTADDIAKAKSQMSSALNSAFQMNFLAGVPSDLKVLPEALVFSTTTFSIGPVDAQGQFAVTPASILRAFEFRETDVIELLNIKAQAGDDTKELQDLKITYANVRPDFAKKQMTFTVEVSGSLAPKFDATSFAADIAGKSQDEARQAILVLPDLADAKVSLWPAWLWGLPQNSSKIEVNVR
ncbi:MAG: hypothetical protein A2855_01045 [Candidatus Liptonbacteria bacterium RIFCSPHIGHO2_01_FULL_57_28]|uniref:Baseplate protein J-like domain-containing protein n=1 Tax=Candidatus Liptonbacteria bacterium RIFCSPHIGHO2_01_FULL_57_28 TaxID=1798647 RepID=A0A1G2CC39_9BACT|nr:MAG: hypothetical protein A2855_01045 [Candidatus Liptonbacteria bacterium RIFCSPHIGHO2_01_FULL_57_28]